MTPSVRLAEELPRLRPLKVLPENLALRVPVHVGPTGTVVHNTHPYSMPPEAIGIPATLYLYRDRVRVVAGRFDVTHDKTFKRGEGSTLPDHHAALVAAVAGKRAKRYLKRQQLRDFGAPALDYLTYGPEAAHVLYHVVNDRHLRKRPRVFTTNKPLNAWGRVLHDPDLAAAILDRVLKRGRWITLDRPSGRTKHLKLETDVAQDADRARISGKGGPEFLEPTLDRLRSADCGIVLGINPSVFTRRRCTDFAEHPEAAAADCCVSPDRTRRCNSSRSAHVSRCPVPDPWPILPPPQDDLDHA